MEKVFVLNPRAGSSSSESASALQRLLSEGYKVKFANSQMVAIAGAGSSYSTEKHDGRIVYILEKLLTTKGPIMG